MDEPTDPPEPERQREDVHLVLLLHGLYGSPANLWCLEAELQAAHSDCDLGLAILNCNSYTGARTWDGIDVNAHRAADEMDAEIARLEAEGKRVTAISITGYSLGGLIARALVGELAARTPSFFDSVKPVSFCTIATPHLGVLKYSSWTNAWVHAVGQRLFSRTGQQLYCLDKDSGRPLLCLLADPELIYHRALSQFPRVTVFANGVNDLTVPYPTAAISAHDPFVDHEKAQLRVELEGKTVARYYPSEPDMDEVDRLLAPSREETPVPTRIPGMRRSNIPPVFFLPWWPFRYLLIPLLPLLIPVALTAISLTFALHTFQSAQRIREHSSTRRLLLAIGDDTPLGTPSQPGTPRSCATTPGRPVSSFSLDPERGLGSTSGRDTPPLGPAHASIALGTTQPVLTPIQRGIIANMDTIPQLERVTAWFPYAFNAHAVIIARNARSPKWKWQEEGIDVVRVWAGKIVAAVEESVRQEA